MRRSHQHFFVSVGLLLFVPLTLFAVNKLKRTPECVFIEADSASYSATTHEYTNYLGEPQLVDYYTAPNNTLPPLVIYIHGGAWSAGHRKGEALDIASVLMSEGFAFASFDYPLVTADHKNTFPAAIAALRCGLRYLYKESKTLQFDPEHVAVMGTSAGATLAALMAYGSKDSEYFDAHYPCEHQKNPMLSPRLNIGFYGIYNLEADSLKTKDFVQSYLRDVSKETKVQASPLTHLTARSPQTILVHGTADTVVPFEQTSELSDALLAAHVPTTTFYIEDAPHAFVPFLSGREVLYESANCKIKSSLHALFK